MASLWTNKGVFLVMSGALDLDSASGIKVALMKNSYTPNVDDNFMSGISSNECSATNYTGGFAGAGRKSLSSLTVTEDDTNDRGVWDAADPATWTALGGGTNNTLRYVAVIQEITNDAASPVICVLDMQADKATNGGDFSVQFSASGIGYFSTV